MTAREQLTLQTWQRWEIQLNLEMEDGKIEVLPNMHAHVLYVKLWCKLPKMSHLDERGASKDNWGVVGRLDLVGPPVTSLDSTF